MMQLSSDIEATLMRLSAEMRGPALSRAIQPAAMLVLQSAEAHVPTRGDERLKHSLFAEESLSAPDGAEWVVGVAGGKGMGWYAKWVEFGTAPHEERRGTIVHPGAAPKPFLRPALDENQNRIPGMIGENLRAQLEAV